VQEVQEHRPQQALRQVAVAGGEVRGTGTVQLPNLTESTGYKRPDWNDIDIVVDANILRLWLNKGGGGGGAADEALGAAGPVGLYVGGTGEVRFRDVSYKDLSLKEAVAEKLSPNFRMTQLTPFYYSFASACADFDRDGNMDVVSGPFIFMGPDFTKKREFYLALATRPGVDFSSNWLEFAGDFTNDGWPDVLLASTSNTILYVNPKGRVAPLGFVSQCDPAGSNRSRGIGDERYRRRRKARLRVHEWRCNPMGEARSRKADRAMALHPGRRSGNLRCARHRCR
jgi:hypothetical protein